MKRIVFLYTVITVVLMYGSDQEQGIKRINDQETVNMIYAFEEFVQQCQQREDGQLEGSSLTLQKWQIDGFGQPFLEIYSNKKPVLQESIDHQMRCLQREIRLDQSISGRYACYIAFAKLFSNLERWFCSEASENKIVWIDMGHDEHVRFEKTADRVIKSSFIRLKKPDFSAFPEQEESELVQKYLFSRKRGRGE